MSSPNQFSIFEMQKMTFADNFGLCTSLHQSKATLLEGATSIVVLVK